MRRLVSKSNYVKKDRNGPPDANQGLSTAEAQTRPCRLHPAGAPTHLPLSHPLCSCRIYLQRTLPEVTHEVESLTMPYGYIRQERVNLTEKYCVHSQIISQNSPCANRICTVAVVQQLLHKDFALTEKVTAVVHDQAANMELSLEILNRDLGWESLHCSAHCLQLCL